MQETFQGVAGVTVRAEIDGIEKDDHDHYTATDRTGQWLFILPKKLSSESKGKFTLKRGATEKVFDEVAIEIDPQKKNYRLKDKYLLWPE